MFKKILLVKYYVFNKRLKGYCHRNLTMFHRVSQKYIFSAM